ncbi:MAG: hypothetical protein RL770_2054 [Pseudomonadota bacterium]
MTSDLHQRRRPPTDEELSNIPWLTLLLPKELERAVNALRVGDAEKGDFVCRVGRPVTYWFGNVSGLLKMSTDNIDGGRAARRLVWRRHGFETRGLPLQHTGPEGQRGGGLAP